MPTLSSRLDQFSRLLQIILAVRAGCPNTRDLAELCEVSRRTIYRDLELLKLSGLPIEYRADRQGYQITPSFLFPTPQLNTIEALTLTILVRGTSDPQAWMNRHARHALNKVLGSLPVHTREHVEEITEDVDHTNGHRLEAVLLDHVSVTLLESILRRRRVRMVYPVPPRPYLLEINPMEFDPYRLQFARLGWYVLGRSTTHNEMACRLDLIEQLEPTEIRYQRPEPWDHQQFMRRLQAGCRDPARVVRLRISAPLADGLPTPLWHPAQRIERIDQGTFEMLFPLEPSMDVIRQILPLEHVEVLAPPELRHEVQQFAVGRAQRHAPTPQRVPFVTSGRESRSVGG